MLFLILDVQKQTTLASPGTPALWVVTVQCPATGEIQEFAGKEYRQVLALIARTKTSMKKTADAA